MIVWKHHIADDYEKNGVPVDGNGVGTGGTIFRDFDKMKQWLAANDSRRFYVAPINIREDQLMPTEDEGNVDHSLMANSRETVYSLGPFAPIEEWEQRRHSLNAKNWYSIYKQSQRAAQVSIDTSGDEASLWNRIREIVEFRTGEDQRVSQLNFDWTGVQSALQKNGYPNIAALSQAVQSRNKESVDECVWDIYTFMRQFERAPIEPNGSNAYYEISQAWRKLRDFSQHLEVATIGYQAYSFQQAQADFQKLVVETKENMQNVAAQVSSAIGRIPNWKGYPVSVIAQELYKNEDFTQVSTGASVEFMVSGNDMNPSFTAFSAEDGKINIDDVLDAGDTDFFTDPALQQDYFSLIGEMKNPGSSSRPGKMTTLYTARPIRDRQLYMNATQIPVGLFLTQSYQDAEGIATDLGSADRETRDVWRMRIDSRYLVQTLDIPGQKQYQVVGNDFVPVGSMELVSQGESRSNGLK